MKRSPGGQLRRASALAEPGLAEQHRRARRDEIERDAGDDLVAARRDRRETVHQAEQHRDDDAEEEPGIGRAGDRGADAGGEGGGQHLALEADVEDAGPLRIETGQGRQQQRRRQAQRRVEDQQRGVEVHQAVPSACGASPRRCMDENNRASRGRNMCSSAPANRMTRPWMTTIMSRVMVGMSKASSAPPW